MRTARIRASAIWLTAALAGVLLIGALGGCGATSTSTLPANVVAKVGRYAITTATLAHWTAVEAVLAYEYKPKQPVPRGLVPDPPAYTQCVGYLASIAQRDALRSMPTSELRRACAAKYHRLASHVMDLLLTDFWIREQARTAGIGAAAREVNETVSQELPTRQRLRRFLKITGETLSDERFVVESKLLLRKLQLHASIGLTGEQRERAIGELASQLTRRWRPGTSCRSPYVVVECSQYRAAAAS